MNEWNNCPCWYKYRAVGSKIGGWIFWQLLYIFHASSILLLRCCCCLLHYAQCTRNDKLVQWINFWAFVLRCDQIADKCFSFHLGINILWFRQFITVDEANLYYFLYYSLFMKNPNPMCSAYCVCFDEKTVPKEL